MIMKKNEYQNIGDCQYCNGTGANFEKKGTEYYVSGDCKFCNGTGDDGIYNAKRKKVR